MNKFIKLTEHMTQGECKVLILNTAYISHIQAGVNGKDTHVRMCHAGPTGNQHYYFVTETANEIWEQING